MQHRVFVLVFTIHACGDQLVAQGQRFHPEEIARGQVGQLQKFDIVALVVKQRALVRDHGHGVVTDPQRQRSSRAVDPGQGTLELDSTPAPRHGGGRDLAAIPGAPDFDDAALGEAEPARLDLRLVRVADIDGEPFDDKGRSIKAAHGTEQGDRRVGLQATAQIVSGVDVVGDDNAVFQAALHRHTQSGPQRAVGQIAQIGRPRVDRLGTNPEIQAVERPCDALEFDVTRIVIHFHTGGAQAAPVSITGYLKRRTHGERAEARAFEDRAGPLHDDRLTQDFEAGRAVVGIALNSGHRALQRCRDIDARGLAAFAILGHGALHRNDHAGAEIVFPGPLVVDSNLGVVDIEAHAVDKDAAGTIDGARTRQTRADDALAAAGATAAGGIDESGDAAASASAGLQAEQAAGGDQAEGGALKFWVEALFHDIGSSRNVLS